MAVGGTSRTLEIIIRARDLASKSLRRVGRVSKKLSGGMQKLTGVVFGLQGAVMSLAATVGATILGKSFLNAAVMAERYRMQLKILTGSQKQANMLFEEGAKLAGEIAFEYKDIMGTVTAMRGVVKGSNEDVIKWTKLIADVAAAVGMDIETTTQQITRMYSAGAQAAELFKERGKLAMLGFTVGVSYSADQTREKLLKMWEDPASALNGAAKQMANTWEGMMSMMGDSWFQFRQQVMEKGGVFDFIKALAQMWLNFATKLKKEGKFEAWALSMGQTVIKVLGMIAMSLAYVGDGFRGWLMIWDGLKLGAVSFGTVVNQVMLGFIWYIKKVVEAYQWLLKMQKHVGGTIEEIGQKLWTIASNARFFGKEIAAIAKGIAEAGAAFTAETQASIDSIEDWKTGLDGVSDKYQNANDMYLEILDTTNKHLAQLAGTVPYHDKVNELLKEATILAHKFRMEREKISDEEKKGVVGGPEGPKVAKPATRIGAEQTRLKTSIAFETALIEQQYKDNEISAKKFYDRKRQLINESAEAEILAQQQLAEIAAKDPDKLLKIETKIYQLRAQLRINLMQLGAQEAQDEKARIEGARQTERLLSDITARAATTGEFGLASQFAEEARDMENRQADEIQRLNDLVKQGYATREELDAAYRAHAIEKDRLLSDQRTRLVDEYLNNISQTLGFMEDAFGQAFEASGKKIKEFFYLQKAASIGQTIISTYQAAQGAYKAMVDLPIVGPTLAVTAAAAAIAAGLARVEAIRRQSMASGGKVAGSSPHSRADNIPINATAGEWVHPVKTVQYYGGRAMEAIRTMQVPREVVQGWSDRVNTRSQVPHRAYAAGGMVAPGAAGGPTSLAAITNVELPEALNLLSDRLRENVEATVMDTMKEELAY